MAGRPMAIDQPYNHERTIGEQIIYLMGTGSHVDTAAASCGINRDTLHRYLKAGARARTQIEKGTLGHPDDMDAEKPPPDAFSLRCMTFSDAVARATSEWELRQEAKLETATRDRTRTIITRTVDRKGNLVSEVTRTETEGPDLQTLRWRLTRRAPHIYGDVSAVEHSGPGGEPIPIEVRASALLEKINGIRRATTDPDQSDPEPPTPEEPPCPT